MDKPSLCHIIAADLHLSHSKGEHILGNADDSQISRTEVSQAPLRDDETLQEEVCSPKHLERQSLCLRVVVLSFAFHSKFMPERGWPAQP